MDFELNDKPSWINLTDSLQSAVDHIRTVLSRQAQDPGLKDPAHLQGLIRDAYYCLDELRNHLEPVRPSQTWVSLVGEGSVGGLELQMLGRSKVVLGGLMLELRPRFVELLCVLALHPEGLTGEQLALAVWGELADPARVKTELCRLRQWVPLDSRPYRLKVPVKADFLDLLLHLRNGDLEAALRLYQGHLLPRSEAPEIAETRVLLEESLRRAILAADKPELTLQLAERLATDLELWEASLKGLTPQDNRYVYAQTQVTLLQARWQAEPLEGSFSAAEK